MRIGHCETHSVPHIRNPALQTVQLCSFSQILQLVPQLKQSLLETKVAVGQIATQLPCHRKYPSEQMSHIAVELQDAQSRGQSTKKTVIEGDNALNPYQNNVQKFVQ